VFVSKKAVELLLETFEKHLRTSVQSLGQRSAFRSLEQVIKSICSSLARVEPRQVRHRSGTNLSSEATSASSFTSHSTPVFGR
jgi:hypothetical protein